MDNSVAVRMLLILAFAIILFAIVAFYTNNRARRRAAQQQQVSGFRNPRKGREAFSNSGGSSAGAVASASGTSAGAAPYPASIAGQSAAACNPTTGAGCFPKDTIQPMDLIPKDSANSSWAHMNPAGQGDVGDQNFLTAGYNLGIDTQSSSLRNANRQVRSEPPNPQTAVSPWNVSTIQPDMNRRPLEIGGDY